MNGEPGFTKHALTALKAKIIAAKRDNQEVVCAIMLNEIVIRKHVEWDGKQFRGYIDLGTGIITTRCLKQSCFYGSLGELWLESTMRIFSSEWSYWRKPT
jgi:hypothetical protein